MERCGLQELEEAPVGRYVAGTRFIHFCAAPTLWGLVVWGSPDDGDLSEIWRSLPFEFRPPSVPHAALIDASRLVGSESDAFARVEHFLAKYSAPLAEFILRLAIVRPSGLGGAIVAGAHSTLAFSCPVAIFEDVPRAVAWLEPVSSAHEVTAGLANRLAAAQEAVSGTPPFLALLRASLEAHPDRAGLATAARSVAMSQRSLQRKLAEAGTSLQDEVARARVKVAQRMLATGSASLSEIAIAVGCSSLPHFSALFKRVTGVTPGAFRRSAPRTP